MKHSDEDGFYLAEEVLERYRQQHADERAFLESEWKGRAGRGGRADT